MLLTIIFIFGLIIGSFLNVIIDRLPQKKTFVKGRSYCDFCHRELSWFDLIPVFSFIFLKGKCRYCKKKLSFQYPLIEIITGVIFIFSILSPSFIYSAIVACCLLLIFMIDLKYGIIPDQIIALLSITSLLYLILNSRQLVVSNLLTGLIILLFFLLLVIITKGKGMGMGDVKFVFAIGLILGFPLAIISIYLAFLTGAFVSIILILLRLKRIKKDTIPFGPFLAGCAFLTYFFGSEILNILKNFFNF